MDIFEKLEEARRNALKEMKQVKTIEELNEIRINYLGKKGLIAAAMGEMRNLDADLRPRLGAKANEVKGTVEEAYAKVKQALENEKLNAALQNETIDVTLPGVNVKYGSEHPLLKMIRELEDLFIGMGYDVAVGPEVELDKFNFEYLNLPKGHPARDMQDTFYIDVNTLLRTHTSAVQSHVMLEAEGKPVRIVCPGKVYRRDDDDATHSHQFMQMEGLVLGKDVTFGDLKGTLLEVAKKVFGDEREIRLRPSYFPFTEPSVEVDVTCFKCGGKGCPICKNTGWIEVLGAGMVNKNVLQMCGYDDTKIQGFAFGIGIERFTMLKYGIDDIRNFYINDLRFLNQFKGVK